MTDEADYYGVSIHYHGIGKHVKPEVVAGKKAQPTYVTGQAPVSGVWTDFCLAANAISSNNGQLETGHFYALAGFHCYSTEGVFLRFKHSDFGGAKPGGQISRTIYFRKGYYDFAKQQGRLPVFSSSSPLTPELYAIGTTAGKLTVYLIDLGTSNPGEAGVSDFNAAVVTTTNGGALTICAVVAGDSLYVQDGRGAAALKASCVTGTAPLRGQIRSTDLSMQPNPIEQGYVNYLAQEGMNEVVQPEQPLKPNSLLNLYISS